MSYILDALRKSESRRRMGQAPGLGNGSPTATSGSGQSGPARFVIPGLAVLAIVGVAGVVFVNRDLIGERIARIGGEETPSPEVAQPIELVSPVTMEEDEFERGETRSRRDRPDDPIDPTLRDRPGPDGSQRERVVSDPDEIEAELARRVAREQSEAAMARSGEEEAQAETDSRRARATPRTSVSAPAPRRRSQPTPEQAARAEQIERRLREIEARRDQAAQGEVAGIPEEPRGEETTATPAPDNEPGDEPLEVASATTQSPAEPWRPGGPEYVRVWDLPLSIRRDMPELKLTIHVYTQDEQRRFVLVNGQRFTTGDVISGGVRLAEIRPEGAVIDYRNYRFLLEP